VMSQQSDMAETVYGRLRSGPVTVADLVGELRTRWGPDHGVGEVHRFVEEAAACLLGHDDVEVGDMTQRGFTPWALEPWDAHSKLAKDLMAMSTFLEDRTRYAFRRAQI
jgi:hypothetical protein